MTLLKHYISQFFHCNVVLLIVSYIDVLVKQLEVHPVILSYCLHLPYKYLLIKISAWKMLVENLILWDNCILYF